MQIDAQASPSSPTATPEVASFVHHALGLRFEMRFKWETRWWPIDAREVAESLAAYYSHYGMHSCLEQMREGKELASVLALYRMQR